jgi:hypothetical protein
MAKMKSSKRKGRNGERPTNKRYKAEKRWETNKAKRVARVKCELAKAKAHREKKVTP